MARFKRGMLYATFYAKFQDMEDTTTTTKMSLVGGEQDPFNLDNIGDGYDVWTRGETQLLVLAVVLVVLTLLFAAIVALDCGRNAPVILRSGTLRDVVRRGAGRSRRSNDLKAPPVSILAPPPYTERGATTSALPI